MVFSVPPGLAQVWLQLRVLRIAFGVCMVGSTDAGQEWFGWCWPPEGMYCVRTCSYVRLPAQHTLPFYRSPNVSKA